MKHKPGRLKDIAAAALTVFTRQGYRLTQVADIAREAGISAGAVYTYVAGKEALLELAITEALGEVDDGATFFTARGIAAIAAELPGKLQKRLRWPLLRAAVRRRSVSAGELEAVATELFTLAGAARHLNWLLDRCARDVVELDGVYESAVRARLIGDFTTVVDLADGVAEGDDELKRARGRALFEMIVWMGMHRHRDRQPPTTDDAVALRAVLGLLPKVG